MNGRVGALLELGSGFNPECTGRENVFINGAILGVPRSEIERRLDEIVAFADIGEFIDQPVKTYSSGMFVRLAFAVTTSLDADVLLIDEALAVGDVFFRQKCYRRLEELRARGVAIVLVSHAMNEVEQFCQRALLLDERPRRCSRAGRQRRSSGTIWSSRARPTAPPPAAIPAAPVRPMHSPARRSGEGDWPGRTAFLDLSRVPQVTNGRARCTAAALCDGAGRAAPGLRAGRDGQLLLRVRAARRRRRADHRGGAGERQGHHRARQGHARDGTEVPLRCGAGPGSASGRTSRWTSRPGEYTFNVGLGSLQTKDYETRAVASHAELDARLARICLVPAVGAFAVVLRTPAAPVQLLHHGVANLPGSCRVSVVEPP